MTNNNFKPQLIRQIDILCNYFDAVLSLQSQTRASSLVSPCLFFCHLSRIGEETVQKVGCGNLQGASLFFFLSFF